MIIDRIIGTSSSTAKSLRPNATSILLLGLLGFAWFWFFVTPRVAAGEFYAYTRLSWLGPYGLFWRPLPLNVFSKVTFGQFGSFGVPYAVVLALVFTFGVFCVVKVAIASLGQSFEGPRFPIALLAAFVMTNVHLSTSIVIQFTITDYLFMIAYCIVFYNLALIIDNRSVNFSRVISICAAVLIACMTKEFAIVAPFVLFLFVAIRHHDVLHAIRSDKIRFALFLLLLAIIYIIYISILYLTGNYLFRSLSGGISDPNFRRADLPQFISNVWSIAIWVFQLPFTSNYPYIFNPTAVIDGVGHLLMGLFSVVVGIGLLAAVSDPSSRKPALTHLVLGAVWAAIIATNGRVANAYMAVPIAHLAISASIGAPAIARLLSPHLRALAAGVVIGLGLWNLSAGARVMHAPSRSASFHGALSNLDLRWRSQLIAWQSQLLSVDLTIDMAGPPEIGFYVRMAGPTVMAEYFDIASFRYSADYMRLTVALRPRAGGRALAEISPTVSFFPAAGIGYGLRIQ